MFPKYLWDITLPLLESLNTPRSLTVSLLIQNEEWEQLVMLTCDPAQYLHHDSFYRDVMATELLRKCADLPTKIDKARVATEGFYASEKRCFVTNERLRPILQALKGFYPLQNEEWLLLDFLAAVRKRISRVLGRLPTFLDGRHGPGATFSDKGKLSTIPHKMESRPQVTSSARALLPLWVGTAWFRALAVASPSRSDPLTVPGNRFTTVPKDATKDRGIAIEPSLNVFFQLGIGKCIRQRLKLHGYDLDDGQHLHRRLASLSSRKGHLATIDLSSASDTVATNLVRILLPEDWLECLETLRSPSTYVEGRWHRLQKFSSMGNGFTFELETLIFSQICEEVCARGSGGRVFCYGDDIIVPTADATEVIGALGLCGFSTNRRKTFTTGLFRESCGGDFFNGLPARGFYLKSYPDTPPRLFALHNGLRAAFESGGYDFQRDFNQVRLAILKLLPAHLRRLKGPKALGDAVLHDEREAVWSSKTINGVRLVKGYVPIPRHVPLRRFKPETQLASALYGVPSTGPTPRGVVSGYTVRWLAYS